MFMIMMMLPMNLCLICCNFMKIGIVIITNLEQCIQGVIKFRTTVLSAGMPMFISPVLKALHTAD